MTRRDLFSLSLGNLLRRRTRTILAIVGVVVGTAAIVVMLSIGFGLSYGYEEEIASYGNLHTIEVYNYGGGGPDAVALDDRAVEKIKNIEGVGAATPIMSEYLTIGIGHMKAETSIMGIDPEVMEKFGYEVEQGRLLNASDSGQYRLVFGKNVPQWFYNPKQSYGGGNNSEAQVDVITTDMIITGDWAWGTNDANMGEYKYEDYKAEGIGLLANENDETSYNVYMPIDSLKKLKEAINKSQNQKPQQSTSYQQVMVYVDDIKDVGSICDIIKNDYGFSTYSLNDWLESAKETAKMIEGVLGGIGAVSLLVAAIGIANTMVMSVYERTKEIGIMKVIGASVRDIKKMFLIEAGMIGFAGGVIGLILSYGLSILMNTALLSVLSSIIGTASSKVSVIPVWVALGALGFATVIGVISGYSPAKRATKLSALEGLKND